MIAPAPDPDPPSSEGLDALVGDLFGVLPRFARRSAAQLEFGRGLLSHLPCLGSLLRGTPDVPIPEHEARQPTDVLTILTEDPEVEAAPLDEVPEPVAAQSVPAVESLAVPGYDSLAASQVIPRLAMLSPDELAAIGRYEAATRNRQTILHRVQQLLEG